MENLKGSQGFEQFYLQMYGARWPKIKEALLLPKKHVAISNPYAKHHFPEPVISIPDLHFNHQISERFMPPEPMENGCLNYYLLDAASVLPVESLEISPGEKVVDLCAAPGGKSFLCAIKLQGQGLLVSNDRSAARRARIHKIFDEYIPKTEQKNLKVTGHDATKWSLYEKSVYDKVLLDAPCSSERHVLEDPKELSLWAPGRTKAIAVTQFAMLASALDIVENDDIIKKLYQKRAGRFELIRREFSFGEPTEFGWQVLPDNSGWGPFYLAIIRRIK
jgi:5-methylcytosine rRNA methyltransferase NSUN4